MKKPDALKLGAPGIIRMESNSFLSMDWPELKSMKLCFR